MINEGAFDDNISISDYSDRLEATVNIATSTLTIGSDIRMWSRKYPLELLKSGKIKYDLAEKMVKSLDEVYDNNKKESTEKLNKIMEAFIQMILGEMQRFDEKTRKDIETVIKNSKY